MYDISGSQDHRIIGSQDLDMNPSQDHRITGLEDRGNGRNGRITGSLDYRIRELHIPSEWNITGSYEQ